MCLKIIYLKISKITPQTLDQYWSTLVYFTVDISAILFYSDCTDTESFRTTDSEEKKFFWAVAVIKHMTSLGLIAFKSHQSFNWNKLLCGTAAR